jgi:small subunit ribosomal protein S2
MPSVTERWIGGTLTNFPEIKKRVAHLKDLTDKKEKGELSIYTKKERLLIDREMDKLNRNFSGIVSMDKAPTALFVIDAKHEEIAVTEAKKSGIPVISLSRSDCNLKEVDYPILANDSSVSSVKFFVDKIVDTYKKNLQVETKADEEVKEVKEAKEVKEVKKD